MLVKSNAHPELVTEFIEVVEGLYVKLNAKLFRAKLSDKIRDRELDW